MWMIEKEIRLEFGDSVKFFGKMPCVTVEDDNLNAMKNWFQPLTHSNIHEQNPRYIFCSNLFQNSKEMSNRNQFLTISFSLKCWVIQKKFPYATIEKGKKRKHNTYTQIPHNRIRFGMTFQQNYKFYRFLFSCIIFPFLFNEYKTLDLYYCYYLVSK